MQCHPIDSRRSLAHAQSGRPRVLDADPTADITNTRRIVKVMLNGY